MKLKTCLITLSIAIIAFFNSCSNDYSDNVSNTLNSIILKADATGNIIGINQILTFTVEGNDGNDYTAQSQIYVNGSPLSGNTHQFSEIGDYSYYAVYEGLTSNTLEFSVVDDNYMTLSNTLGLRGQVITFNYYDVNGTDLTDQTTFYVNDNPISGNTFSTDTAGEYQIYAIYEGLQSDSQSFTIFIPRKKLP